MSLIRRSLGLLLAAAGVVTLVFAALVWFAEEPGYAACDPGGGPAVVTDEPEYLPFETVHMEGCGFEAYEGQALTLRITHPDLSVFTDTVAIVEGGFSYDYQIGEQLGTYQVEVLDGQTVVVSTTFADDYRIQPSSLTFMAEAGGPNPASQVVQFQGPSSCGDGTATDNRSWLSVSPASFTSGDYQPGPGSHKHIDLTISVDVAGLVPGTYTGTVTVDASGSYCSSPRTASVTLYVIAPNPDLSESCGIDMALVIDSSASISSSELAQMKAAYHDFVDAFLPGTPTQIAVVDFDSSASAIQGFTDVVSTLHTAIDTPASGGYTNWQDALSVAHGLFDPRVGKPELIVFASDGNPNYSGHPGNWVGEPAALQAAITEANAVKAAGIHVVAIGIGNDLDIGNLMVISGPDDVITSGFETLAQDLANLASQLCGGTINVHKIIDQDCNLGTTGDQTDGEGWGFTPSVTGGSSTPAADTTDVEGFAQFSIDITGETATVDVTETVQGGFTLADARCQLQNGGGNVGTFDGLDGVNGIVIGPQDIVSCTFHNCPPRTPTPTLTATPLPTSTPTATATATATPLPTSTPTATATATATPLPTSTPTATATATATPVPTSTPTATATATATPLPTSTPTATATATATPLPTSTPTATATATNTPTVTSTPTATATATDTPTPTATNTPTTPTITPTATNTPTPSSLIGLVKDARPDQPDIQDLASLWLCKTGPDCFVRAWPNGPFIGKGELKIAERIFLPPDVDSPNDSDTDPEGLAAYEFQVKYDHKTFDLVVSDAGADGLDNDADTTVDEADESVIRGPRGNINCTMTIMTENWIMFGCVSSGQALGNPQPVGLWLATINVQPDADMFQRVRPTKDNGVVKTILDENCEVADIYASEPWPGTLPGGLTPDCEDVTITVRMLEGDLNLDCQVNALDEQLIAQRYGSFFGVLLYDPFYDLEPKLTDFDIDIKDVQFVFGRDDSDCQNPLPNQPPMQPPP